MSDTFSGHDLETGLLQRVRRWRDALPVLVLLDALRVAGSPLYVGLSLVAVLITRGIVMGAGPTGVGPLDAVASVVADGMSLTHPLDPLAVGLGVVSDFRWIGVVYWTDFLRLLALIALWSVPATTIARAGACYAAGREQSFVENATLAMKRAHWVVVTAAAPVAGVLGLSTVMLAVGLVARAGQVGLWLAEIGAVLALPIVILMGLIAAGSFAAVPLAWAALVIEKRCDMFDSLSRGYEYLYRRPVHLLFFGGCGYALVGITFLLGIAVSSAAVVLGTLAANMGSGGQSVPYAFAVIVGHLPLAVASAALWGLVGAIYLLMRQAANQQEIEDIAVSPVERRDAEMPTLQTATAEADR